MKVTLSLTHQCNLSCRYCYSGRAVREDMSFVTAMKIIDFIFDITPPEKMIEVCFFGGEPLLRFDLIKKVVHYIHEQEKTVRPVQLSITTNGTRITQPILNFLRKERIDLCISIDGPQHVHDLNRRYGNGQGSFTKVLENLCKARDHLDRIQVNAVYGPETVRFLPETVSFFAQLGVPTIHLNPDICASWTERTCSALESIYMQIADYYMQSYQRGNEIAVNLIDGKILLLLKGGYTAGDMCGMGETEWGFAPSGNIYPCERLVGEDDGSSLCLGNIHTGLDVGRRCSLLKQRGNHDEGCRDCDYRKYCMNWCGCTNYHMTGHTDSVGPMMCASEKAAIHAAKHVLITLSSLDNEIFLDHLMHYVYEGCRYEIERR